ncbi:MAG: phosphatidylglycerophosphatase A [Planctomycetales bacterium]|nr:phosphatidylglycerophosphatase A [Planctomycetales bacterium]
MQNDLTSKERFVVWLATGFGVGWAPFAPGTVGTALGIPLGWFIVHWASLPVQLLIIGLLVGFGVPICGRAAQALKLKDPGCVVWDEMVTMPIILVALDAKHLSSIWVLLAAFGLHRLFDISKLPPGRQLERLPGGWGIMTDDVAAGCYGWVTLRFVLWLTGL